MNTGDRVPCRYVNGYNLTEGRLYTVLAYEAPCPEPGHMFTWPAYVQVEDDGGKAVWCHAQRFGGGS